MSSKPSRKQKRGQPTRVDPTLAVAKGPHSAWGPFRVCEDSIMSLFDVLNPATEVVVASVPSISLEETDRAIEKAARAFETLRHVAPGDRARLLRRFASLVDEHLEELAQLEVANAGHTIGNARWEAGNVRDVLDYLSLIHI